MSEVQSTFQLRPGSVAPTFALPDATGRVVARDEVMGASGLLVVFACNHCPYVVHVAHTLGNLAREILPRGIGTVAINSNDFLRYPQDAPEKMPPFAAQHAWDFPYLLDSAQTVAMAFAAACTPDFFLLNGEGRLFYAGQFDSSRPSRTGQADGSDLREAIRKMLAGESPPPRPMPSSGCNIKWR